MTNGVAQRGDAILRRLPADKGMHGFREFFCGAEIGVWDGRLSKYLLSHHPGLILYMVDRWHAPEPGSSYATGGALLAQCSELAFKVAQSNAAGRVRPFNGRGSILQGESVAYAQAMQDAALTFVFVDADHTEAAVTSDLNAWWPAVQFGGWMCGHDWGKRPDMWGVQPAVEKFASDVGTTIELDEDSTWFFKKPAA